MSLPFITKKQVVCIAVPHIIHKYLDTELALNRMVTLVDLDTLKSTWGDPKHHRENEWWLILDHSSLADHSINDGIDAAISSLHYSSVDHAVAMARAIGPWCTTSKTQVRLL